jgi:molybdopterin converting factor small subunit
MAKLTLLLFATARQAVGRGQIPWEIPANGTTLGELLARVTHQHPELAPIVRISRFVRNGEYVTARSTRLHPGDEVAIHPPYSGG